MRRGKRRSLYIFGAFVVAIAGVLAWAFVIELGILTTPEVRLAVPYWRGETRIAVLSDVHTGSPHNGIDKVARLVDRINEKRPDLIVMLGDFVTGGPRGRHPEGFVEPERTAQEFKRLRAPLGVFAVLGNHDWWFDGHRVAEALRSAGITVLENEAVKVPARDPFWLGGIADLWTRNPDVTRILAQVTDSDPVVLITHNPDVFPSVPPRVSLTLGAHTHGGQVQVPFWGPVVKTSEYGYNEGHFVEGGRHLFVTTGIGTSILGVRFLVPPEVVMMTLVGGADP